QSNCHDGPPEGTMAPAKSPAVPSAKGPGRIKQWWLDRSVRAKALTLLAVPLIALFGTSSASLVLEHDERAQRAVSRTAFNVITTSDQVLADVVNGETGVRGYVATGDSTFLDPYNVALSRIGADRNAFTAAAAAQSDLGQRQVVHAAVTKVLSDLAQLRLAVGKGASSGSLAPLLNQDKTDMNRVRGLVAGIDRGPAAEL